MLRVAVVGCGVGGSTAAWLLARLGHQVTLVERAVELLPVGAGILLQPSGQGVMRRLGLLDDVLERAERIELLNAVHGRRQLVHLRWDETQPDSCAYGVRRATVMHLLVQAAAESGVTFRLGVTVDRVDEREEGAFLDTSDGVLGPFDLVVAADGSRSRLRRQVPGPIWEYDYGYGAFWTVGTCTEIRSELRQWVRDCTRLCGILPTGGGQATLFWLVPNDQAAGILDGPFAHWVDEVRSLAPPAGEILADISGWDDVVYTHYRHCWIRNWRHGRLVLLGDAAHAMSPHLGQGLNLALQDAEALATALEAGPDLQSALTAYVRSRRPAAEAYLMFSLALTPFFQSSFTLNASLRDLGLSVLGRVPWTRRTMVRAMSGTLLK